MPRGALVPRDVKGPIYLSEEAGHNYSEFLKKVEGREIPSQKLMFSIIQMTKTVQMLLHYSKHN